MLKISVPNLLTALNNDFCNQARFQEFFFWGGGDWLVANFFLPSTFLQHYTTLMQLEYLSIVNI